MTFSKISPASAITSERWTRRRILRDAKTIDAVERCIERIAEAARKPGNRFDTIYPDLDLPTLRKVGSVLRHDYDSVQPAFLWGFARDRLDPLKAMAARKLNKLSAD